MKSHRQLPKHFTPHPRLRKMERGSISHEIEVAPAGGHGSAVLSSPFAIFASSRFKLLFSLLLLVFLSACSGLGGEPQIVATLPPAPTLPPETGYPLAPPDMSLGAAVFANRCTACHGSAGGGDGPLAVSGEIQNPRNFQDPTSARAQTPAEWYNTVTNGRIERMMPPWRDALTEEQRWAVSLYTYTLHYTPEQLTRGQELWADCDDCPAVGDQAEMVATSDNALLEAITQVVGEDVSEEDRYAMVAYARSLSLANTDAIGFEQIAQPVETPEVTAETTQAVGETITISGQVTNGTTGGSVPPDTELALFVFAADFSQQQFETVADAEGNYTFADVSVQPDSAYVVTTAYRDRIFTSVLARGSDFTDGAGSLPITIYELTEDPATLEIAGMVTQVNVTAEGLEIAQVFNFVNSSDRAYSTSQNTPDGRPISLVIPLPPGALVAGFSEQGRYVFVQEEFTVLDTAPVLPGEEHLVQLIYFIDYGGDAIIEQELNYAVNGPVRLLLRPESVSVISEQLPPLGTETVGDSTYAGYGTELNMAAGGVLRYELSGEGGASAVTSPTSSVVTTINLLPVVLALIGIIILLIVLLIILQRRYSNATRANIPPSLSVRETLLAQIAELDAAYEAGELDEESHQRQRAALKAQVAELMRREEK